jgi:hypothetical protein
MNEQEHHMCATIRKIGSKIPTTIQTQELVVVIPDINDGNSEVAGITEKGEGIFYQIGCKSFGKLFGWTAVVSHNQYGNAQNPADNNLNQKVEHRDLC